MHRATPVFLVLLSFFIPGRPAGAAGFLDAAAGGKARAFLPLIDLQGLIGFPARLDREASLAFPPSIQAYATDINEHGQIIGGSLVYDSNQNLVEARAILWDRGEIIDLPGIGLPLVAPADINDHGQVVGIGILDTTYYQHAVLWDDGQHDLGTLGGSESDAYRINERGQVIGTSITAAGELHGFFWDSGVMTDLGTLGGNIVSPMAINDHGQVVGSATTPDGRYHAFLWEAGAMTDLDAGEFSAALDINGRGQIVGVRILDGMVQAFLWDRGTFIGLPGVGATIGFKINKLSDVGGLGDQPLPNGFGRAPVLWKRGSPAAISYLGTLGGSWGELSDLNDRGQACGWSATVIAANSSSEVHAVLMDEGALVDLGTLGGGVESSASAINNHGLIVGTSSIAAFNSTRPFLWENGVMQELPLPSSMLAAGAVVHRQLPKKTGASGTAVHFANGGLMLSAQSLPEGRLKGEFQLDQSTPVSAAQEPEAELEEIDPGFEPCRVHE